MPPGIIPGMATSPAGKQSAPPKSTTKPADPTQAAGKAAPDLKAIAAERVSIIEAGNVKHGTERDIVRTFMESHATGHYDERLLPQSDADTAIQEYAFRHGRADIILFHQDGTATIIEAKDGKKGYTHVVAGIGQCSLYAAQLGAKPGVVRAVHRALLWSSVGSAEGDARIEEACELAGVIPLPYPSTEILMATRFAAARVIASAQLQEADHGCA